MSKKSNAKSGKAKAKAPAKKAVAAKTVAAASAAGRKTGVAGSKLAAKGKSVAPVAARAKASAAAKPSAAKAVAAKSAAKVVSNAAPARTIAAAKPASAKKTEGSSKKMALRVKIADIVIPAGYRPSDDEPFMSELHRAYFRRRLMEWKDEILRQTRETLAILHEDSTQHADLADRATSETDRATELRTRDRQRKLISKIDAALSRIEDGSYGYCEDTGEPIGLKRLDARPIATLSVEAQERHERREKVYREE